MAPQTPHSGGVRPRSRAIFDGVELRPLPRSWWYGEAISEEFDPQLHPRDRRGRWARKSGLPRHELMRRMGEAVTSSIGGWPERWPWPDVALSRAMDDMQGGETSMVPGGHPKIVLNEQQSETELAQSYVHEFGHAIDFELERDTYAKLADDYNRGDVFVKGVPTYKVVRGIESGNLGSRSGAAVVDSGLGTSFISDPTKSAAWQAWLKAVRETRTWVKLHDSPGSAYLETPTEVWARTFAQYVAIRQHDALIWAGLRAYEDMKDDHESGVFSTPLWGSPVKDGVPQRGGEFEPIYVAIERVLKAEGMLKELKESRALDAARSATAATRALPAKARQAAERKIAGALERHLRTRDAEVRRTVGRLVRLEFGQMPDDVVRSITDQEVRFEREFRRKMLQRVRVALRTVLRQPDPEVRAEATRRLLETQRRWIEAREQAIAGRVVGRSDVERLMVTSPEGALWMLSETVLEHTPDCFPDEVLVDGPPTVAASRREYTGKLVTIVLASGQQLRVTPNHPVLTARGWVAAQDVRKGVDYVFCDGGRVEGQSLGRPQYGDDVQRSVAEVFEAIQEASPITPRRDRVEALDFHGDGVSDTEVDVVAAHGRLRGARYAALYQDGAEVEFFAGSEPQGLRSSDGGGTVPVVIERPTTVACVDCGQPLPAVGALGVAEAGFREDHRRAVPAHGHAVAEKGALERLARDGQLAGERLDGLSGEVTACEVVDVRQDEWSGHVYSLETMGGWHTANGIIVGNCLAMAGRFWPWNVLRVHHPPLHFGCPCYLVGKAQAEQMGLMADVDVVSARTGRRWAARFRDEAEAGHA